MKRITFSPDELAQGFDTLQRANQVQGMFLSSGIIKGSMTTQDKILDTAEIIGTCFSELFVAFMVTQAVSRVDAHLSPRKEAPSPSWYLSVLAAVPAYQQKNR